MRQVKNGLPYLCFHTSTQTLHVSQLPGDQRTPSHPPKPRRFLRLASRHSTLIYIACLRKRGVALKNGFPYLYLHTSIAKRCMHVNCKGIREHAPTLQNRAGFSVLPVASSTLIYIACLRKRGVALKNGVPYLYLHTSIANAACQSTTRGSENTLLPSETAQVFSIRPVTIAL